MTNNAFVQALAERMNMDVEEVSAMADQFVNTFMNEVLVGNVVSIQGFGNFEVKEKAERKMYNPATKTFKVIPSKKTLGFKMSATLKGRINQN